MDELPWDGPARILSIKGIYGEIAAEISRVEERADSCRKKALLYPPRSKERNHWLLVCRLWCLHEARLYSIYHGANYKPNYSRKRDAFCPF